MSFGAASKGRETRGRRPERTVRNGEGEDHVYNRVRVLREERGLSQMELAADLGLNHRTLGYLEREEYQPKILLSWQIADYFGLPVDFIFSGKPMEPMSQMLYGRTRR